MSVALLGCGRHDTPPDTQTDNERAPLIQAPLDAGTHTEAVAGELTAGGIPATYRAVFTDDQLTRISESRRMNGPPARADAQYDFKGARLLKYSGASLSGADRIDLEFDVQGALLSARGKSGKVAEEEIRAIRTRAQTLRSHALARRAVRSHAGH